MEPLQPGAEAPPIPGADLDEPTAVVFYKVTCPTCQMAAPKKEDLHRAFPGRVVAVAQDPPEKVRGFASEYGLSFEALSDTEPYELSDAYGIRTVPTVFVIDGGEVREVVESWDREGWNRAAKALGELAGVSAPTISEESDGLPPFRPG